MVLYQLSYPRFKWEWDSNPQLLVLLPISEQLIINQLERTRKRIAPLQLVLLP